MKRIYNPTTVTDTMDNLDKMRRLYRGVNDIAKKIEDEKSNWRTVTDLFTSSQEVLRAKLRDYCEKLIYQDFQGHGRKIEELLWRKGFYEVFCAAKKLRKGNIWSDTEKAMVSLHLSGGVGFYNHLILGLQLEHNLEIIDTPDIKYTIKQSGLINNALTTKSSTKENGKDSEECKKAVLRFIHRSLICIGDLARYKLDLDPLWIHWLMAVRYYKMANYIDHTIGMPHNQLGTVAGSQNYGLDAAYHYLRCMMCPGTFEGAESNLKRIITMHSFTGNEEVVLHRCIARLLFLLQLWDSEEPNIKKINQESQVISEALLNDIQICLELEPSVDSESDSPSFFKQIKTTKPEVISDEMVFKIVSICLMYITKLQSKDLIQVQGATAFTLALLSQLVQFVTVDIQKSFMGVSKLTAKDFQIEDYEINELVNEEEKKPENGSEVNCNSKRYSARHKARSLLTKLRRSRRRINSSDSDASDVENGIPLGLSDDDINSDISETGEDAFSCDGMSDPSEDDDEEELKELEEKAQQLSVEGNQSEDLDEPVKRYSYIRSQLKPQQILDVVSTNGMLASIKICYDWLISEPEVLKRCAKSASSLIKRTCKLINLINFDVPKLWSTMKKEALEQNFNCWEIYTSVDKALEFSHSLALPEDVELRGIPIFRNVHKDLDWQKSLNVKFNPREEALMRILKMVDFGKYLCSITDHSGVIFDSSSRLFRVVETEIVNEPVKEVEEEVADDFMAANDVVQYMNDIANDMAEQVASADSTAMMSPTVGMTEKTLSDGIKKTEQSFMDRINIEEEKGKLMRNMGTLWLQAEVEALEHRLDSKLMPPFLVPDHEVLVKFMPTLKRLVYSKKFVVVIPSIVISTLDEVKRSSAQAREATRWLETQLERGSRFLKAQRPNERLPLPYIKGPKPKERESWIYFQIIECCYYLTQKTINFQSDGVESPVVTLLLGYNNQSNNEQARATIANSEVLAKSAGINIEHVQVFHTKWKASSKSHG